MKRIGLALAICLWAANAIAAPWLAKIDPRVEPVLYWDFSAAGTLLPGMAFSRASQAWCFDSTGTLQNLANNIPCLEHTPAGAALGYRSEIAKTNAVLWDRNLTNGVWVNTGGGGTTAALDQTGIDGVASSASSLSANGANGIACQSITLGSSARFQSVYVKRITGTGVVSMAMDATNTTGATATYTAITVTNLWTRVSIPTQTIANPIVCFKIATSGDKIGIDVVQNEGGTYATSPMITGAATFTRADDIASMTGFPVFSSPAFTLILELVEEGQTDAAGTIIASDIASYYTFYRNSAGLNGTYNGALSLFSAGAPTWTNSYRIGLSQDSFGRSVGYSGSAIATDGEKAVSLSGASPPAYMRLGYTNNGCYSKLVGYNYRLKDTDFANLLVLGAPFR